MKKSLLVILCLFTLASTIGAALAVNYVLTTSAPKTVTVTAGIVQVPVTLAVSSDSINDQDSLTLTASTSASGNGLNCVFRDGSTIVGNAVITNGKAEITLTNLAVGTHVYTAGP